MVRLAYAILPAAAHAAGTYIVGYDNWPGYYTNDATMGGSDTAPVGFYPDLAKAITAADGCSDIEFTWKKGDWKDCEDGGAVGAKLKTGTEIQLCAGWNQTAARKAYFDFTTGGLSTQAAGIIVGLDGDGKPEADGMSDLTGKAGVYRDGYAPGTAEYAVLKNTCSNDAAFGLPSAAVGVSDPVAQVIAGTADFALVAGSYVDEEGFGHTATMGVQWAFVQTGMTNWADQLGSFVSATGGPVAAEELQAISDCIAKVDISTLCAAHPKVGECKTSATYTSLTSAQTKECCDGYCGCCEEAPASFTLAGTGGTMCEASTTAACPAPAAGSSSASRIMGGSFVMMAALLALVNAVA